VVAPKKSVRYFVFRKSDQKVLFEAKAY
jgi:hypothetical protein